MLSDYVCHSRRAPGQSYSRRALGQSHSRRALGQGPPGVTQKETCLCIYVYICTYLYDHPTGDKDVVGWWGAQCFGPADQTLI